MSDLCADELAFDSGPCPLVNLSIVSKNPAVLQDALEIELEVGKGDQLLTLEPILKAELILDYAHERRTIPLGSVTRAEDQVATFRFHFSVPSLPTEGIPLGTLLNAGLISLIVEDGEKTLAKSNLMMNISKRNVFDADEGVTLIRHIYMPA